MPFLALHHEKASPPRPLVFVLQSETDIETQEKVFKALVPQGTVLSFPSWDCFPYDRVSPSAEVLWKRAQVLCACTEKASPLPFIVLTTLQALIQRVPPVQSFSQTRLSIKPGMTLDFYALRLPLTQKGYRAVDTVREPGEFAVRGGLMDIFPPHQPLPSRLEFHGDHLESLHRFDPFTQRRQQPQDSIEIFLTSEIPHGLEERQRFLKGYEKNFGPLDPQGSLYKTILNGTLPKGIEHALPLFYPSMVTLLDFLENPIIFMHLESQDPAHETQDLSRAQGFVEGFYGSLESSLKTHFKAVEDAFENRLRFGEAEEGVLRPLNPQALYIAPEHLMERLTSCSVLGVTSLMLPQGGSHSTSLVDLGIRALPFPSFKGAVDTLKKTLTSYKKTRILLCASSWKRCEPLKNFLKEAESPGCVLYPTWSKALEGPKNFWGLVPIPIDRGFLTPHTVVLSESDIFGPPRRQKPPRSKATELLVAEASSMALGDYLVHAHHGIGRYQGLQILEINGAAHECLVLIYEGNDKLFIPVENLEVLTRYGSETTGVRVDKLGSAAWQERKAKAKKDLLVLASGLLKTAAQRRYTRVPPLIPAPEAYETFCARFPYTETEDQAIAIQDVLEDLQKGEAMDRLICGDVGFGKTEVALRAAFTVASQGQQVALLTPTTLLCRQHFKTFSQRFQGSGLTVTQLSRLTPPTQVKQIHQGIREGSIPMVIGTHTLLSDKIQFADLGLVIVDEEQHFGVKQKEKLKNLKSEVHVLTLTATPIPRTLQLSLAGVRSMSLMASPPVDRVAIRTFVLPYDAAVIREALQREHHRGGQSFYVSPRIADLPDIEKKLATLVPNLKVGIAHGQMPAKNLEKIMEGFYDGHYDILLATNIIESGIDVPRANTLIVHRCDLFGLSQLYQIRGRIGRSKDRAYAYLTLPQGKSLSAEAQRRIDVMQTLDSLGAGFQLASHDLDIRGAGNILGDQQSGHIKEIGVELYQQMLQEAIQEIKNRKNHPERKPESPGGCPPMTSWTPSLNLGLPVLIPESYIPDLSVRLELYRRLVSVHTEEAIQEFSGELLDRFGPLPQEVQNLLHILSLKHLCIINNVEKVDVGPKGSVISFYEKTFPKVDALMGYLSQYPHRVSLKPNHSLVFPGSLLNPQDRIHHVRTILLELKNL